MPSPGSWITAALYFWSAHSCRATAIRLKVGSLETRAWTAIAVLLALLGASELLQLQPAITNFGRSIAFDEGWYWHRQGIQAAFTKIGAAITVVFSLGLFLSARRTSIECAISSGCAVMIVGFILVRAISLHQVDAFLLRTMFGLPWNRIPEFAGSAIILLSNLSRRSKAMPTMRP
jgi:hypothetical protein